MLQLTNYQLLRGINPNLAAGERAYKMSTQAVRAQNGESPYEGIAVPHNAQFYNFGSGPFTIFVRFMHLGLNYDGGFGSNVDLLNKRANGTGYAMYLRDVPAKLGMQFVAFGAGGSVSDARPFPQDGFFHSAVVTRRTFTEAEAADLNNVKLFIDGIEVSGANKIVAGGIPNFDNENNLYIGGLNFVFMRGYIDSAAFYSVGLSDAEIAALSNPLTRTDRGAKFILDFNQLSAPYAFEQAYTAFDSSSVGQNAYMHISPENAAGRAFVRASGIKTFNNVVNLAAPLNGHFIPNRQEKVTGISRYDSDLTACEYSLDNVIWSSVTFDASGKSVNFPALTIDPDGVNPTLYLRASNANPSFLNAVELQF